MNTHAHTHAHARTFESCIHGGVLAHRAPVSAGTGIGSEGTEGSERGGAAGGWHVAVAVAVAFCHSTPSDGPPPARRPRRAIAISGEPTAVSSSASASAAAAGTTGSRLRGDGIGSEPTPLPLLRLRLRLPVPALRRTRSPTALTGRVLVPRARRVRLRPAGSASFVQRGGAPRAGATRARRRRTVGGSGSGSGSGSRHCTHVCQTVEFAPFGLRSAVCTPQRTPHPTPHRPQQAAGSRQQAAGSVGLEHFRCARAYCTMMLSDFHD